MIVSYDLVYRSLKYCAQAVLRGQKKRCYGITNQKYPNYGARGIRVEYSKKEFIDWFVVNHPLSGDDWTVGRIDHDSNYALNNIRFETRSENSSERMLRNNPALKKRKPVFVYTLEGEFLGRFETSRDAGVFLGIGHGSVSEALREKRVLAGKYKLKPAPLKEPESEFRTT